jgi:phosphatidylglycerol:prolipoprotein diacylglycerol transferase
MRPELWVTGDLLVFSYHTCLVLAFLIGTAVGVSWMRRLGEDPNAFIDLGVVCFVAGIVGGRALHVLADGHLDNYVNLCLDPSKVVWSVPESQCAEPLKGVWDEAAGVCHPSARNCYIWAEFLYTGGLTLYGGFFAASAVGIWLLRRDGYPLWKVADIAAVIVPLGIGVGRIGCFLAGCCFGKRSDFGLAVSFPPNSLASELQASVGELASAQEWSHPVHPTQIYESAMCFAIAAVCLGVLHPRKRYHGEVCVAAMTLYAAGRFFLELLRADPRGGLLGFSTSQLIGAVVVAGATLIHRRRVRSPDAPKGSC